LDPPDASQIISVLQQGSCGFDNPGLANLPLGLEFREGMLISRRRFLAISEFRD
jgi:hypothetical protein